jgi:Ca2+-binding EF-hand superfamily protein
MFDKDGKGHISLADLQSILYSAFAMSSEEVKKLFEQIDHKNDGLITFGILIIRYIVYLREFLSNLYFLR